jgi:hypothetical protein
LLILECRENSSSAGMIAVNKPIIKVGKIYEI